jgi:hypothetical protein
MTVRAVNAMLAAAENSRQELAGEPAGCPLRPRRVNGSSDTFRTGLAPRDAGPARHAIPHVLEHAEQQRAVRSGRTELGNGGRLLIGDAPRRASDLPVLPERSVQLRLCRRAGPSYGESTPLHC